MAQGESSNLWLNLTRSSQLSVSSSTTTQEEVYFDFRKQCFIYSKENQTFYKLPYPSKEPFGFYLRSTGYGTESKIAAATQKWGRNVSLWLTSSRSKLCSALQNLHQGITAEFDFLQDSIKEVKACAEDTIRECAASGSFDLKYQVHCKEVLQSIKEICIDAVGCSELRKDEKKSFGKRRALVDMLDRLDHFGLSKHRSNFLEVPASQTLITPAQCKSVRRQFKTETEYTVTQAISAQA